ncbi:hypothetical protein M8818_001233 [Zalaria obscura]|uniref:Uncharacterized protein n=1 Tax=Zalaria obscura TaxID=2024903 RepID=A0ACC3SKK9_9PEZI
MGLELEQGRGEEKYIPSETVTGMCEWNIARAVYGCEWTSSECPERVPVINTVHGESDTVIGGQLYTLCMCSRQREACTSERGPGPGPM